jgi:hypothetical protein
MAVEMAGDLGKAVDEVVGGKPAGGAIWPVDEQLIARLAGRNRAGGLARACRG